MAFTKPDQILEIRMPFLEIRLPFLEFVRIRNESQLRGIRIPKRAYEFQKGHTNLLTIFTSIVQE